MAKKNETKNTETTEAAVATTKTTPKTDEKMKEYVAKSNQFKKTYRNFAEYADAQVKDFYALFDKLNEKNFDNSLPQPIIEVRSRMRSNLFSRYVPSTSYKAPDQIVINGRLFELNAEEVMNDIFKEAVIRMYLHRTTGKFVVNEEYFKFLEKLHVSDLSKVKAPDPIKWRSTYICSCTVFRTLDGHDLNLHCNECDEDMVEYDPREYAKYRESVKGEEQKARDTVKEQELAEKKKVRDAAKAEKKKIRDAAKAEKEKKRDAAKAEKEKARTAAKAAKEKAAKEKPAKAEKKTAPKKGAKKNTTKTSKKTEAGKNARAAAKARAAEKKVEKKN